MHNRHRDTSRLHPPYDRTLLTLGSIIVLAGLFVIMLLAAWLWAAHTALFDVLVSAGAVAVCIGLGGAITIGLVALYNRWARIE
jgi:hypothetical protein